MRLRGFNLIEVAVAAAIAGIISVAAIGTFAHLNRQLVLVQRETYAADAAKSITDMLVSNLQGVGGGAIRPSMAVWIEDSRNPTTTTTVRDQIFTVPGVRTDRITWATLVEDAPTCTIEAMGARSVTVTDQDGTCCLRGFLRGLPGLPDYPNAITAYAIKGGDHMQVVLSAIDTNACSAKWAEGPLALLDKSPANISSMAGATLSRARIKTLYVNNKNELRSFEQTNFAAINLATDKPILVASDVFDLQFQLGYDRNGDGRIVDASSTEDEWLYNVDGDLPVAFLPVDLRMVGTGVVVGVRHSDPTQTSSARIVGSVALESTAAIIRGAMGRAALRNLFVFH